MYLCEDNLVDWIDSENGLLLTRRKMNLDKFDTKITVNHLYICVTGYAQIIDMLFNKLINDLCNCKAYTVIIIESDVIKLNKEWLNNERLTGVFTWNKPFEHEKMYEIPIGLNYNRQYSVLTSWLKTQDIFNQNKPKLLCMNCSLSTSPERVRLNNIVKSKWEKFCDILPFVSCKKSYYIPSNIEGKIRISETDSKCYDDWKPYKFILSPQGAGLDCHRTWEAIICGIIPIVKSSSIDNLFKDLPVLIVDDWEDINEDMLIKYYDIISNNKKNNVYSMEKLHLSYWKNIIENNSKKYRTINIQNNNISNRRNFHLITYGNHKYEDSKKRLLKEANAFHNIFDVIQGYGPEDLPEDFSEKYKEILNCDRGGGYWLWKPMILYQHFKKLKDGDYLVYLDSGCMLNNQGIKRFNEYIQMLENSEYGILSFSMHNQIEKLWTTKEIFEYYELDCDGKEANSGQLLGGVFIIKKNRHSTEYVKKLVSITLTQSQLYTDIHNKNGRQMTWFKDNRHDQSISSLLRKLHGSIVIPTDESFKVPFGRDESLKYPFWAARIKK